MSGCHDWLDNTKKLIPGPDNACSWSWTYHKWNMTINGVTMNCPSHCIGPKAKKTRQVATWGMLQVARHIYIYIYHEDVTCRVPLDELGTSTIHQLLFLVYLHMQAGCQCLCGIVLVPLKGILLSDFFLAARGYTMKISLKFLGFYGIFQVILMNHHLYCSKSPWSHQGVTKTLEKQRCIDQDRLTTASTKKKLVVYYPRKIQLERGCSIKDNYNSKAMQWKTMKLHMQT